MTNAAKAPFNQLRALWQTLGDSYADLTELEAGPIGVLGMAITCAPSAGNRNGVRLCRPAYDEPALTR